MEENSHILPADAQTLVAKFRQEYGRLCVLIAEALNAGLPRTYVMTASRGEGTNQEQPYVELRWQRQRVNSILALCKAQDIPVRTLVDAGFSSRHAVEEEFMIDIHVL